MKKRCLLWDWKNSVLDKAVPWAMDEVPFDGPISSVANWNTVSLVS